MHARMDPSLIVRRDCIVYSTVSLMTGGRSKFSNLYFLQVFLSSDLLLGVKEYTM